MKLRFKLYLAQLPLVFALVVCGVFGSRATLQLGEASQMILKDNYRSVLAAQRMKEFVERVDSGLLFRLAGRHELAMSQTDEFVKKFEDELRVQESNITEPGERTATEELRRCWEVYRDALADVRGQTREDILRVVYFDTILPKFAAVKDAADVILTLNQDAMVFRSDHAAKTARRLNTGLVAMSFAGCLVALLLSAAMTTRLLRPLGVLAQTARRIGEGDLKVRAVVIGEDETAALARDFNLMAERLQSYRESSLGELIEAQRASQAAIDSLPDPVLVLDLGGQMLLVNKAAERLLNANANHESADALATLPPLAREAVMEVRAHLVSGRGAYSPKGFDSAFRLPTERGDRHFLPRGTCVYTEDRDIVGTTIVLQDVTQLMHFDELKNDVVATVAHELRTPLTSLRMAIHLCAEGTVGPLSEKQADLLHAAREDCERLQSTVDELLDLSRIQAGRIDLRKVPVEVDLVIRAAVESQRNAAAQRDVILRSVVLPGTGLVLADPERIQLVLTNLLTNAIRHSSAQSEVVISAAATDGTMRFEVTDAGPGIPKKFRRAIFDKYFQMPGRPSGGVGLGLFLSKEIVRAHGGNIGVDSPRGQGSTFWFTLPQAKK